MVGFELELAPQVLAIVPQPITRVPNPANPGNTILQQARDQIVVYFNNDDLFVEDDATGKPTQRSAENPDFYRLIYTQDSVENTDDITFFPDSVVYDPATDSAVLKFAGDLDTLRIPGSVPPRPIGPGTWRLRVGTDEALPAAPVTVEPTSEAGSSYDTAYDLGQLGAQSLLVPSSIDPQPFALDLPGGQDEPGHRDIPAEVGSSFEQHINPNFGPDVQDGVTTIPYNFRQVYGYDAQGNPLSNLITEKQKTRVREAVELWAKHLGIQFLETADQGLTFVTGDPRRWTRTTRT